MFRLILLVLCAAGIPAHAQSSGPIDYAALSERIAEAMVRNSYKEIDPVQCAPLFREAAHLALQGGETAALSERAREAGCLHRHAMIAAMSKGADDPYDRRGVVDAWQAYPVRYVRIKLFSRHAPAEFEAAMEGFGNERLILDLRGNPGGGVVELTTIARHFAPRERAPLFVEWYRSGFVERFATSRGKFAGRSILILVDRRTASAAEVLTAILKQWGGRHVAIIGEHTYGKSSVQWCLFCNLLVQVRQTVALIGVGSRKRWFAIDQVGIEPDMALAGMSAEGSHDPLLSVALRYYGVARSK